MKNRELEISSIPLEEELTPTEGNASIEADRAESLELSTQAPDARSDPFVPKFSQWKLQESIVTRAPSETLSNEAEPLSGIEMNDKREKVTSISPEKKKPVVSVAATRRTLLSKLRKT